MNIEFQMNVPSDYLFSDRTDVFIKVKGKVEESGGKWALSYWALTEPSEIIHDLKDGAIGWLASTAEQLIKEQIQDIPVPEKP